MFDEDYNAGFIEEANYDDDVEMTNIDAINGDSDDDFSSIFSPEEISKWSRTPVNDYSLISSKDLDFQWLDIDMISSKPLAKNPNPARNSILGPTTGTVPVVRIDGVTNDGQSVAAFIHGYTPYGYFALPSGYDIQRDGTGNVDSEVLENIRVILNEKLKSMNKRSSSGANKDHDPSGEVLVHGVQFMEDHQSIMGFVPSHIKFLKVYVAMPTLVPTLKRAMEEGVGLPGIKEISTSNSSVNYDIDRSGMYNLRYSPFECNVPFVLRFMVDRGITGAGWISLPKGTYSLRPSNEKVTHCQVRNLSYIHSVTILTVTMTTESAPMI
jgi:DNA polymerase delta subunit 1